MIVLGLTGSVGMGKTKAARDLRSLGIPVHDADACVHRLLGKGGAAVPAVGGAFPGVVHDGAVDRTLLGGRVFDDPAALVRLEDILHPMVAAAEDAFLRRAARRGAVLAVLDIPLLYETGAEGRCDAVAVVSAPPRVQLARVLARPGVTRARQAAILDRQMPDADKRRRADYIIPTGLDKAFSRKAILAIVTDLLSRYGVRRGL
ncbi:MAG: dephospho-CoA kinase [Magnetospirillum sp. WYHS-4]